MLRSIFGEIIGPLLLEQLLSKLDIFHLRFGFKSKDSTNMCTMILKEMVAYFTANGSYVHCVMPDA